MAGDAIDSAAARVRLPERLGDAIDVLEGVLEEGRERGSGVVDALAGRRTPSRWPWALAAAAVGALAGAGVAFALRGALGQDAPGAQDPAELLAVVDVFPAEALVTEVLVTEALVTDGLPADPFPGDPFPGDPFPEDPQRPREG